MYKKGSELTNLEIDIINSSWKKQWGDKIDTLGGINDFKDDLFFFVFNNEKVVAIARLIDIKIIFLDKEYYIFGLSRVLSLEQGQGYGKQIVLEIKDYVEKLEKTLIGFCSKKDFYKKFGYGILEDQMNRFLFNGEGDYYASHVLYLQGKDDFIEKFVKNPSVKVQIPIPHW